MNRTEWLKKRQSGIGGSDIGALLGGPFARFGNTPLDVFYSKVNPVSDDEAISDPMLAGLYMEDSIRKIFEKKSGIEVEKGKFMRHPEKPFLVGTPDGIFNEKGFIEIKNVQRWVYKQWEENYNPPIPLYYYSQVQHYYSVGGFEKCYFVPFVNGFELFYFKIDRDQEFINFMTETAERFWNEHVIPKIPPEVETVESMKKYPNRKLLQTLETKKPIYDTLNLIKRKESAAKEMLKDVDSLKNNVKLLMKDHQYLEYNNRLIAEYKQTARGRRFKILI